MNLINYFDMDNSDIQVCWRYYQKTINQIGSSLSEIMHLIDAFLHPVFDSLFSGEVYAKKWDTKHWEWI